MRPPTPDLELASHPQLPHVHFRQSTNDITHTTSRNFNLRRAVTTMFQPERKIGLAPSVLQSIKSFLMYSCRFRLLMKRKRPDLLLTGLNVLLVCIPISVCFPYFGVIELIVFTVDNQFRQQGQAHSCFHLYPVLLSTRYHTLTVNTSFFPCRHAALQGAWWHAP